MIDEKTQGDGVALVLAGAVSKGAFGVGAIAAIAPKGLPIRRIAATSSGALTAAVIGAGLATGQIELAAKVARELWLEHGAWSDIQHVTLGDWFHVRGVLDTSRLVALVREGIERVVNGSSGGLKPAHVTFVTASLNPLPDTAGPLPTYELAIAFDAEAFVNSDKWNEIATAAAASATFPGVFAPTRVGDAPCVDGGAVNNAPIAYAIDDPSISQVIVITSEAGEGQAAPQFGGPDLVSRVADIVINERVSNDIAVAKKTNDRLDKVISALRATNASPETTAAVIDALGWRKLALTLIRPDKELGGNAFSGFFDKARRQEYIEAGERAAAQALP
jgi:predicted acylesterase/phospholipase RssA